MGLSSKSNADIPCWCYQALRVGPHFKVEQAELEPAGAYLGAAWVGWKREARDVFWPGGWARGTWVLY